jgi:hypothetical protein
MATAPKLLRALVDYYQGGAKVYAAGNVYPESDVLLLMKARGEAEVPKQAAKTRAAKAAGDTSDTAADASQPAPESGDAAAAVEPVAADQAQAEQGTDPTTQP